MIISSNPINFHDVFGLKGTIDIFSEVGFQGMDFNAGVEEYYTDTHNKEFYKNIKDYAHSKGIIFEQTHAPFGSSFVDEEKTKLRFGHIVKSMENSSYLGADMIVIHPCKHINYIENNNYSYMMEYNIDFYKRLIPYAENYNIKIAIENIGNSITETSKGLLELVNELNSDVFTICYDVGHANICGQDPAHMIKELGKKIGCTHIHDNDGIKDSHILPYHGTIDWESVMSAFAQIGYEGNLNYEAGWFLNSVPDSFRKESAKYMVKVGTHLIERFMFYKNNQ